MAAPNGMKSAGIIALNRGGYRETGVLGSLRFRRLGIPDRFVEHGSQNALRASLGLDRDGIIRVLRELAGGTEGPGEA